MNYVQVNGQQFVYKGEPIRLRGFGIGTWLCLEHFMMGLPTSEKVMRGAFEEACGEKTAEEFFTAYQTNFIQEDDFKLLKETGVNFLRVPFNYRLFIDDNDVTHLKQEGFAYFDELLSLCSKYEIFVMFDLHTTPGGQNPDWHSDNNNGVPLFWEYQIFRRQVTELWKAIAKRYKDEPFLMGYDLLNEPAMANWPSINEFYEETIGAIREVDKNHIIILEGDLFSMDFSELTKFEDPQIALGFHYYPTVWHRDLLNQEMSREVRKQKISEGLDRLVEIKNQFNRPAFCGEFGYAAADVGSEEFALELLADTVELMEAHELSWTLWCYKDAHIMSMVSPKKTGNWMKLVQDIHEYWSQDIEKEQANYLLEQLADKWYPNMTEEEHYLLQFRFRATIYQLQKEHILIPELTKRTEEEILQLPEDFKFEHCQVNKAFQDYMKMILTK